MLVLSRKAGESIHIDGTIKIEILKVQGNNIKIGIEAPRDVPILRSELDNWSPLAFAGSAPTDVPPQPMLQASLAG